MSTKKLIGLWLSAVIAITCSTCAPVDPSATPKIDSAEKEERPEPETLPITPKPAHGPQIRLEAAIENVKDRKLRTDNGFWTIFHGILGMGFSTTLFDDESKQTVNAIEYICAGGELRGLNFIQTKWGLDVQMGPTLVGQGHQDQFIAEMGQWGMAPDQKFVIQGNEYTYMDFVRMSKARAKVNSNQELSWAICVIGQYEGTDIHWTNRYGELLHFEDLMRYELDASVEQAACGGTHRLFGLTWALYHHLRKGGKKVGVWNEVAEKNAKYRDLAKKFQNADGSFSTDSFRAPGNATDKTVRLNTTGHIFEYLSLALTDAELKEEWMQNAASALSLMILEARDASIDGGSLYHAMHGLLIYYARVYDRETLGPNAPYLPLPPDPAYKKQS